MRFMRPILVGVFACLLTAPFATAGGYPVIVSAGIDGVNGTMKIEGINFETNPIVTLGATPLTVQSASATAIVTNFAPDAFLPGSYVLRVSFGNGRDATLPVTVATLGPPPSGCGTHAPTINVSWPTFVNVHMRATLHVEADDADLQSADCANREFLTRNAVFVDVPIGSTVNGLNAPFGSYPWFIPDVAGTYTVKVTVTDSTGRTAFTVVSVNVY